MLNIGQPQTGGWGDVGGGPGIPISVFNYYCAVPDIINIVKF